MLIVAIACAAFCATFAGGLFALHLKDKLHLVLGFSAGAVIAVAFFDLLPEAIELGAKDHSVSTLLSCAAVGFLFYLVLDRIQFFHAQRHHHRHDHSHTHHDGHDHGGHGHHHGRAVLSSSYRGVLGASSFSAHSFLDGVAIGLAFQASHAGGIVVAIAVLTHDFSDGINTMNVVLKNNGSRNNALRWLWADALAPALGVALTSFITLPETAISIVLALFAGFFLYIGASDLIPESHHAHPKLLTTVMTLLGSGVLYLVVVLAGV
jgi:ZIP family zinc transporter